MGALVKGGAGARMEGDALRVRWVSIVTPPEWEAGKLYVRGDHESGQLPSPIGTAFDDAQQEFPLLRESSPAERERSQSRRQCTIAACDAQGGVRPVG